MSETLGSHDLQMAGSLTRDFAQESSLVASTAASIDLNRDCTCLTLDREALGEALNRETGDPSFCTSLMETRPHLLADVAVFVSETEIDSMRRIVAAIETVSRHPAYQAAIRGCAPATALRDFGPRGAFMGYDFHMGPDGPALIEVNTNAGGAMFNAILA